MYPKLILWNHYWSSPCMQSEDEVKAQKLRLSQQSASQSSQSGDSSPPVSQDPQEAPQLRQRPVSHDSPQTTPTKTEPTSATTQQTANRSLFSPSPKTAVLPPQRSKGQGSLILLWLLILAVLVLVFRRVYLHLISSESNWTLHKFCHSSYRALESNFPMQNRFTMSCFWHGFI